MNNKTVVDISIDRVDINHLRNIVKMCGKDDLRPALTGMLKCVLVMGTRWDF